MKALIYDFETAGLDYRKYNPLQLGACVCDIETGEIIETYDTLIKFDHYEFEQEALNCNKLSLEDCRTNGVEPAIIGERLLDMWTKYGCSVIAGHNRTFDDRFMAKWIYGIDVFDLEKIFTYRSLDTYPLIQLMLGSEKTPSGTSLKQAIKYFDIDMSKVKGNFHSALYDVIATAKLLAKFRQVLGAIKI